VGGGGSAAQHTSGSEEEYEEDWEDDSEDEGEHEREDAAELPCGDKTGSESGSDESETAEDESEAADELPAAPAAAAAAKADIQASQAAILDRISKPPLGGDDTSQDFKQVMCEIATQWHLMLRCEQQGFQLEQWRGPLLHSVKPLITDVMAGRGWELPFSCGQGTGPRAALGYVGFLRKMAGQQAVLEELRW
jgi:hypothetical protein